MFLDLPAVQAALPMRTLLPRALLERPFDRHYPRMRAALDRRSLADVDH